MGLSNPNPKPPKLERQAPTVLLRVLSGTLEPNLTLTLEQDSETCGVEEEGWTTQLKLRTVAQRFSTGASLELGRQSSTGQAHFNGGQPADALAVIPRAQSLLLLHCGPHCPEMHELQAMEECLTGQRGRPTLL
ncbi:unnamed protein product [Boreogadus saida]